MEPTVEKSLYEIRAFIPDSLKNASGSPLSGVDACFFTVKAVSAEDAVHHFFSLKYVYLGMKLDNDEQLFINPAACSAVVVYPVVPDNRTNIGNAPVRPVTHLRRIK